MSSITGRWVNSWISVLGSAVLRISNLTVTAQPACSCFLGADSFTMFMTVMLYNSPIDSHRILQFLRCRLPLGLLSRIISTSTTCRNTLGRRVARHRMLRDRKRQIGMDSMAAIFVYDGTSLHLDGTLLRAFISPIDFFLRICILKGVTSFACPLPPTYTAH
jgi:hypothetical protein